MKKILGLLCLLLTLTVFTVNVLAIDGGSISSDDEIKGTIGDVFDVTGLDPEYKKDPQVEAPADSNLGSFSGYYKDHNDHKDYIYVRIVWTDDAMDPISNNVNRVRVTEGLPFQEYLSWLSGEKSHHGVANIVSGNPKDLEGYYVTKFFDVEVISVCEGKESLLHSGVTVDIKTGVITKELEKCGLVHFKHDEYGNQEYEFVEANYFDSARGIMNITLNSTSPVAFVVKYKNTNNFPGIRPVPNTSVK